MKNIVTQLKIDISKRDLVIFDMYEMIEGLKAENKKLKEELYHIRNQQKSCYQDRLELAAQNAQLIEKLSQQAVDYEKLDIQSLFSKTTLKWVVFLIFLYIIDIWIKKY